MKTSFFVFVSIRIAIITAVLFFADSRVLFAQLIETLDSRPIPFQPSTTRIGHYSNPGQAVGSIPGALFFHFQLFYIGPSNISKLSKALAIERQGLRPGESKTLNIYAAKAGNAIVFRYVADADRPNLESPDVFVVGQIMIEKADKILMCPVRTIDSNRLELCVTENLCSNSIDINDCEFIAQHLNTVNGTTDGPAVVSLTDMTAKAGAKGRVILRASEVSGQYQVYNVGTEKVETYDKGAGIRARKSTVWILSEFNGREYTIVYNRLGDIQADVAPGAIIAERSKIGSYSGDEDSGVEIWRVDGQSQYFLGNGAFRVAPIQ